MKHSIYSYTPNKHSKNSAVLHQTDVQGDVSAVVAKTEALVKSGHKIVGCLEVKSGSTSGSDKAARQSRS